MVTLFMNEKMLISTDAQLDTKSVTVSSRHTSSYSTSLHSAVFDNEKKCKCQGVYQKEIGDKRKMILGFQKQYKAFVDAAIKSQVEKNIVKVLCQIISHNFSLNHYNVHNNHLQK